MLHYPECSTILRANAHPEIQEQTQGCSLDDVHCSVMHRTHLSHSERFHSGASAVNSFSCIVAATLLHPITGI